jgi:hypothetical protein
LRASHAEKSHAETGKIGRHAAFASRKVDHAARKHTDVTRCCPRTPSSSNLRGDLTRTGGDSARKELSNEAHARLQEFRQMRAAARDVARGQRDRAESQSSRRYAPGEVLSGQRLREDRKEGIRARERTRNRLGGSKRERARERERERERARARDIQSDLPMQMWPGEKSLAEARRTVLAAREFRMARSYEC